MRWFFLLCVHRYTVHGDLNLAAARSSQGARARIQGTVDGGVVELASRVESLEIFGAEVLSLCQFHDCIC